MDNCREFIIYAVFFLEHLTNCLRLWSQLFDWVKMGMNPLQHMTQYLRVAGLPGCLLPPKNSPFTTTFGKRCGMFPTWTGDGFWFPCPSSRSQRSRSAGGTFLGATSQPSGQRLVEFPKICPWSQLYHDNINWYRTYHNQYIPSYTITFKLCHNHPS